MGWTYRQNARQQGNTRLTKWTPRTHNRMRGQLKTRWHDELERFQTHWERQGQGRRLWHQLRMVTE